MHKVLRVEFYYTVTISYVFGFLAVHARIVLENKYAYRSFPPLTEGTGTTVFLKYLQMVTILLLTSLLRQLMLSTWILITFRWLRFFLPYVEYQQGERVLLWRKNRIHLEVFSIQIDVISSMSKGWTDEGPRQMDSEDTSWCVGTSAMKFVRGSTVQRLAFLPEKEIGLANSLIL
jgi:hypothetical protein